MARTVVRFFALAPLLAAVVLTGGRLGRASAGVAVYGVDWNPWNTMPTSMTVGQDELAYAALTNSGSLTWNYGGANPVHVSYHWRAGACPGTSMVVWDGLRSSLPLAGVAPSEGTNVVVTIRPPSSAGTYCLIYDLVHEGITWFSSQGGATQSYTVSVAPRLYDVAWGATAMPASLEAGSTTAVTVSMTNTGATTWSAGGSNPVRFSYHWLSGACPGTAPAVWDGVRTALSSDITRGIGVSGLNARIKAPATAGTHCLAYDMVREGVLWFSRAGAATRTSTVTVTASPYGVSWDSSFSPGGLVAGTTAYTWVTVTNAGTLTWPSSGPNPVRVSYHVYAGGCPPGNLSQFENARANLVADVAPGGSATVVLPITAPLTPGPYCIALDLVREGIAWFSAQGAAMRWGFMQSYMPGYDAVWTGASPDPSAVIPQTMTAGTTTTATVSLWNVGTLTWPAGGPNPVRFSYHWFGGACYSSSVVIWDGVRTALPSDVPASGGTVNNLVVTIGAPPNPGTYCLWFDLVHEGVTWFGWQGSGVIMRTVTVN